MILNVSNKKSLQDIFFLLYVLDNFIVFFFFSVEKVYFFF